jgi:hypothetical protein
MISSMHVSLIFYPVLCHLPTIQCGQLFQPSYLERPGHLHEEVEVLQQHLSHTHRET